MWNFVDSLIFIYVHCREYVAYQWRSLLNLKVRALKIYKMEQLAIYEYALKAYNIYIRVFESE